MSPSIFYFCELYCFAGGRLQVVFTCLDDKDHDARFFFYVQINEGKYIGKQKCFVGFSIFIYIQVVSDTAFDVRISFLDSCGTLM